MLEPVQNCFTFYCPDGKTSAHIYPDENDVLEHIENTQHTVSSGTQQKLILLVETHNSLTNKLR